MKKKINIILFVVVASLWGSVIYKYVDHFFFSQDTNSGTSVKAKQATAVALHEKDTFTPQNMSRDPFLGAVYAAKASSKPKARIQAIFNPDKGKAKKVVPAPQKWPIIKYYGFMKSAGSSEETLLISVDGKFRKIQLNQKLEALQIVSKKGDSIKIMLQKESKWIKKT